MAIVQTITKRAMLVAVAFLSPCVATAAEDKRDELAAARVLFLGGNYAEASEAYQALAEEYPADAALGTARCRAAVGELSGAIEALDEALAQVGERPPPIAAWLYAERAKLAFDAGDYDTADKQIAAALEIDGKNRLAKWLAAERHRVAGRVAEAEKGYEYFIDDYNTSESFPSGDDLRYIGLGAAQNTRWSRNTAQFTFLVNELFPSALDVEEKFWPAHYEAGLLFLEKYNEPEANKEFKAALALNPRAAEVYVAMARLQITNFNISAAKQAIERALAINPKLLSAHWAAADAHMANYEAAEAAALLEGAIELNPRSEETLGRLAAAYAVIDGWSDAAEKSARFKKIVADVEAANPHAGEFYVALAAAFDALRRFPAAAEYYRTAVDRLPQLTTARGELGLMQMRLGDEVAARKNLDESFEIDPFNVRVSNMRKVLDVLSEYATIETEHFVIKFDRGQDELLAKYAADYLENQVYPELCKKFGFEPEEKSLFEIFNRSRNTDGHGWFSARMVGLPFVGTVGACAGKMVALASPNGMEEKFNWARVLKHEFVHVLNLQQSRFNIPHWYTEALAVESEGYPRSETWNKLLAERVPKNDLFNLDTINLGFVRPKSSLDWQMAYCQAQLYAQYMLKTYGDDALAKMLAAYRDNLDTRGALQRSFKVEQADFERGYLDFVRNIAKDLSTGEPADDTKFSELVAAQRDNPDDAAAAAKLAVAYVEREEYPKARKLADRALAKDPNNQTAAYALAKIKMLVGEDEAAEKLLDDVLADAAVSKAAPSPEAVWLLASLKYSRENYDAAEKLFALGVAKFPTEAKWKKALAKTYLVTKNEPKLAAALEGLALADADDGVIRKKLAQMALAAGDFPEAHRWGVDAIHCDVLDADAHRLTAEALAGLKRFADAQAEYEVAVRLKPTDVDLQAALEAVAAQAGKPEDQSQPKPAERRILQLK